LLPLRARSRGSPCAFRRIGGAGPRCLSTQRWMTRPLLRLRHCGHARSKQFVDRCISARSRRMNELNNPGIVVCALVRIVSVVRSSDTIQVQVPASSVMASSRMSCGTAGQNRPMPGEAFESCKLWRFSRNRSESMACMLCAVGHPRSGKPLMGRSLSPPP
jgi:hypothetical protein